MLTALLLNMLSIEFSLEDGQLPNEVFEFNRLIFLNVANQGLVELSPSIRKLDNLILKILRLWKI